MAKKNSRWVVNLTALVLAVGLLMGLFTGCPGTAGGGTPSVSVGPAAIFKTDGNGKITGYKCAQEALPANLVIPAKIGDEEIKEIGLWAFYNCTGLRSISLPASITKIGGYAFSGCTGLTSITLPANLTEIGYSAFFGCKGLTSITLPANLTTIGGIAFCDCTGLTSLNLSACTSLTTIDLGAFSGCTGLTSITLPANLTEIGGSAFSGCTGLKSVHLPANLTTIDLGAFSGCTGLISLTIDSANTKYKTEGNILYSKDGTTLILAAGSLTSITNIPNTVTTIGDNAFGGCTGLTSVIFADKNGWAVYYDWEYKNKLADIQQSDLADTSKAAEYLREKTDKGGYCDKYWKKR
ncbi:leucine-rich repeat domain-containing protein [Treponema denticola]|uniref:leucine-rich repeat domain-containing protein n=1 Tax=Treponema denticola TaxID=158 RepID=UPI0020A47B76|nr:leucine-rich repeat domain-containing protein [Treponema denticola]UTC87135.1 leucine-rich repeat protein [Treponema denticola]